MQVVQPPPPLPPSSAGSTLPAVRKSLNESGESDPGYESDSTGSKSKTNVTSLLGSEAGPKATTLPRRSAAVQKISLDRRKSPPQSPTSTNNTEDGDVGEVGHSKNQTANAGLNSTTTVEIISPVRVKKIHTYFIIYFFSWQLEVSPS